MCCTIADDWLLLQGSTKEFQEQIKAFNERMGGDTQSRSYKHMHIEYVNELC